MTSFRIVAHRALMDAVLDDRDAARRRCERLVRRLPAAPHCKLLLSDLAAEDGDVRRARALLTDFEAGWPKVRDAAARRLARLD